MGKCVMCEKRIGIFDEKCKISGGSICTSCLTNSGIKTLENPLRYSAKTAKKLLTERKELFKNFASTKYICKEIYIDENNRLFRIGKDFFTYDNLVNYTLIVNKEVVYKAGVISSIAGGISFGLEGALLGSIIGGKTKNTISDMTIRFFFKNAHQTVHDIRLITSQVPLGGIIYNSAIITAEKIVTALDEIVNSNLVNNSRYYGEKR